MALKGNRDIKRDDIRYTCPTAATRGVGMVVLTAGSGTIQGDTAGACDLVANPSGYKFAGLLLNDVVNIDQTRYKLNEHKDEVIIGSRVRLLRGGVVVTNKLKSGDAPTDGEVAYLTANGEFTKTVSATGGVVATPQVGIFRGLKDESGYVPIEINIP